MKERAESHMCSTMKECGFFSILLYPIILLLYKINTINTQHFDCSIDLSTVHRSKSVKIIDIELNW